MFIKHNDFLQVKKNRIKTPVATKIMREDTVGL